MGGMGTSMVVALAAVLWLVYLVPTWVRHRQYLATERNAVRLQQTLRILAETAEVPETVRAEADARSVAAHRRTLQQQLDRREAIERARDAEMAKAAARTLATLKPAAAAAVITHSRAALRLRRSRLVTTAVLVVAVVITMVGLTPLADGAGLLLVAGGAFLGAGCLTLLSRFAAVSRSRAAAAERLRERAAVQAGAAEWPVELDDVGRSGWMPVPLPKPLYLSKPAYQAVVSEEALAEARERALAGTLEEQRLADRAEQAEKVVSITGRSTRASRFAQMGLVGDDETPVANLDDTLRRRRAV